MAWMAFFAPAQISASGMAAERLRMEVTAANIANAYTTRTPDGTPYRRRDVVFAALLDQGRDLYGLRVGGVRVQDIIEDRTPFQRVYNPGHPDADATGYVLMPNVNVPLEMVNLLTASRAYEANVKVLRAFRQMIEQAIQIARG